MTYTRFPHATLMQIGDNLSHLGGELQTKNKGVVDCDGLCDHDMKDIQDAISDFRDEWQASLNKLMENIGQWGELSTAIGTLVRDFDDQTAAALRPSEP